MEQEEEKKGISRRKLIEVASNMAGYLKELKEHDTPEEQVEFWKNMGMNRELMDYFDVLDREE